MKLKSLITARAVIFQYAKEKLQIQTAYKLARFLTATECDEMFYSGKIKEILNKYALKDEAGNFVYNDGNGISLQPDKTEECRREIADLEDIDTEVPFRFSPEELGGLKVNIAEMLALQDLVKEDIEKNAY